jgi:serine protease Do
MDDVKIIEAVERYIAGEMSPDERVNFEGLRKSNPEVDQAVVEHTFFLQQIARYENTRQLKSILNDTHIHLAEKGEIKSPKLKGGAKVVYLFNRYKRTAVIAASIAGITALSISAVVWSFSPGKGANNKDLQQLSKEIEHLKTRSYQQAHEINSVKDQINAPDVPEYTTGGTGFLVDTKGYLITNAHVVEGAKNVAVQNAKGKDLKASIVFSDSKRDIAIIKIIDTAFKAPTSIPYAIKKSTTDIAEPIFSLGYPRNDIVYGEGYLAAKTGYDGDTLAVQISINANKGNSGSPIINRNGEIIGVLNARQTSVEGAVFAIQSKYIYDVLSSLRKSDTTQHIKLPAASSLKGAGRSQQVKKISDFVYMVKVN